VTEMNIPTGFVDKARFVRAVFTDVEREYDALVHMMTLSFDRVWRRRMYSKMNLSGDVLVLDLACGTGLVTFELNRAIGDLGAVIGVDLSPAMLRIANQKKHRLQCRGTVDFVRAVGEYLPFRKATFRYVTIGLALRNFADKSAMFHEALRVLFHSGWFLSVDFVRPEKSAVWRLYKFHIFHVLPALSRLISSHWKYTMVYLANSILKSSTPSENSKALLDQGFERTRSEKMTLGIVALICGQKWEP
jgi:demethylmenaquinone methyltransferase/2-methoxy-6-polyprenyl-1,4-benzoquinol methylase